MSTTPWFKRYNLFPDHVVDEKSKTKTGGVLSIVLPLGVLGYIAALILQYFTNINVSTQILPLTSCEPASFKCLSAYGCSMKLMGVQTKTSNPTFGTSTKVLPYESKTDVNLCVGASEAVDVSSTSFLKVGSFGPLENTFRRGQPKEQFHVVGDKLVAVAKDSEEKAVAAVLEARSESVYAVADEKTISDGTVYNINDNVVDMSAVDMSTSSGSDVYLGSEGTPFIYRARVQSGGLNVDGSAYVPSFQLHNDYPVTAAANCIGSNISLFFEQSGSERTGIIQKLNRDNPADTSRYNVDPQDLDTERFVVGAVCSGLKNRAYIVTGFRCPGSVSMRLIALDLTTMQKIGNPVTLSGSELSALHLEGDYLYVAENDALGVYSVQNLNAAPTSISTHAFPNGLRTDQRFQGRAQQASIPYQVSAKTGNYLTVMAYNTSADLPSLLLFNISTPGVPTLITSFTPPAAVGPSNIPLSDSSNNRGDGYCNSHVSKYYGSADCVAKNATTVACVFNYLSGHPTRGVLAYPVLLYLQPSDAGYAVTVSNNDRGESSIGAITNLPNSPFSENPNDPLRIAAVDGKLLFLDPNGRDFILEGTNFQHKKGWDKVVPSEVGSKVVLSNDDGQLLTSIGNEYSIYDKKHKEFVGLPIAVGTMSAMGGTAENVYVAMSKPSVAPFSVRKGGVIAMYANKQSGWMSSMNANQNLVKSWLLDGRVKYIGTDERSENSIFVVTEMGGKGTNKMYRIHNGQIVSSSTQLSPGKTFDNDAESVTSIIRMGSQIWVLLRRGNAGSIRVVLSEDLSILKRVNVKYDYLVKVSEAMAIGLGRGYEALTVLDANGAVEGLLQTPTFLSYGPALLLPSGELAIMGDTSNGEVGISVLPVSESATIISLNDTLLEPVSSMVASASAQPLSSRALDKTEELTIQWQGGSVANLNNLACTAGTGSPCSRVNLFSTRMDSIENRAYDVLSIFGAAGGFYGTFKAVLAVFKLLGDKLFARKKEQKAEEKDIEMNKFTA